MEDDFFDQDDHGDNLFDDDDALDYILYEECCRETENNTPKRSGCLGMLLIFIVPPVLLSLYLSI